MPPAVLFISRIIRDVDSGLTPVDDLCISTAVFLSLCRCIETVSPPTSTSATKDGTGRLSLNGQT